MTRFWDEVVVRWEGLAHTKDPVDAGGETFCGISRRWNPSWSGWAMVDAGEIQKAIALARGWYGKRWEFMRCHEMKHEGLALKVFEQGILFGIQRAVKWLQEDMQSVVERTPATAVDGIVGPATLAHVNFLSRHQAEAVQVLMAQDAVNVHLLKDVGMRRRFLVGHLRRAGAIYRD